MQNTPPQEEPPSHKKIPKRDPFEKTVDDSILLVDKILSDEVSELLLFDFNYLYFIYNS